MAPPTVTDWLWLVSYPVLYAGIGLLVRARTLHFERSLWLDAALAALAVAAIGAAVLFGAVVESTGGSPLTAAMNLAYPLADALLLGLVVAVLAITGWRLDRAWLCILGGTAALTLADSGVLYQAAVGSADGITLLDAGWPLAMLLLAAASWQPAGRLGAVRAEGARVLALPAVFGLSALAILVYGQFEPLNTPAVVLAATSHARGDRADGVHVPREDAAPREDPHRGRDGCAHGRREPAQADDRPRRHARRPDDGRPDAARPRRVQGLQRHVRPSRRRRAPRQDRGEAQRSGRRRGRGLSHRRRRVLRPGRRSARTAAMRSRPPRRCRSRSRRPGFRITAAYGTVALPEEADGVAEALRIVDGRMYDEKDGRRASAGRQSRDVLLRVLYERDARLQGHLSGLVELVRAVGVGLGLPDDELADVALAAELHEVGKLAIPDSILLQARAADRRGVELRAPPPAHRRADPVVRARARQGVGARALDPGAHGRHGLSGPAHRRGHPARLAHHRRLRGVRRHDLRAPAPSGPLHRGGSRRASPLRRQRSSTQTWSRRSSRLATGSTADLAVVA